MGFQHISQQHLYLLVLSLSLPQSLKNILPAHTEEEKHGLLPACSSRAFLFCTVQLLFKMKKDKYKPPFYGHLLSYSSQYRISVLMLQLSNSLKMLNQLVICKVLSNKQELLVEVFYCLNQFLMKDFLTILVFPPQYYLRIIALKQYLFLP